MDILSVVGLLAAIGMILFGIVSGQPDALEALGGFWDPASFLIVVCGTLAVLLMSFPMEMVKKVPQQMKLVFLPQLFDPLDYIGQISEFAKEARKKGLLALEDKAADVQDIFLRSSLLLIVDANEPEKVRGILEDQLGSIDDRHAKGRAFFDKGAAYAPAFGMLGTLVGLVNMLSKLSDPASLGPAMAVALITTFYGSFLANVIFYPMSTKLKVRHDDEMLVKTLIMEGVLSIQAGENPKHIEEKLLFMLPEKVRDSYGGGEGGGE